MTDSKAHIIASLTKRCEDLMRMAKGDALLIVTLPMEEDAREKLRVGVLSNIDRYSELERAIRMIQYQMPDQAEVKDEKNKSKGKGFMTEREMREEGLKALIVIVSQGSWDKDSPGLDEQVRLYLDGVRDVRIADVTFDAVTVARSIART